MQEKTSKTESGKPKYVPPEICNLDSLVRGSGTTNSCQFVNTWPDDTCTGPGCDCYKGYPS